MLDVVPLRSAKLIVCVVDILFDASSREVDGVELRAVIEGASNAHGGICQASLRRKMRV